MSDFPNAGDWSDLPPAPRQVTTADRAQTVTQFGVSGQDDPGDLVDAAFNREWRAAREPILADDQSSKLFHTATIFASQGYAHAKQLEGRVRTLLENDQVPFDGRLNSARAAIAEARAEAEKAMDSALAHADILNADATVRAMPEAPIDPAREVTVRQDIMLQLEGLRGLPLGQAMAAIAGGPNRQAASMMVKSSLRDALLNGRIPDADDRRAAEGLISATAIAAVARYGEPEERSAAKAITGVVPMRRMLAARQTAIRIAIAKAESLLPR